MTLRRTKNLKKTLIKSRSISSLANASDNTEADSQNCLLGLASGFGLGLAASRHSLSCQKGILSAVISRNICSRSTVPVHARRKAKRLQLTGSSVCLMHAPTRHRRLPRSFYLLLCFSATNQSEANQQTPSPFPLSTLFL